MTTKEQERKALEQIKKIVADLGENSYVGTAFAGCFEDAEQNIEYNAAFSPLGRAESVTENNRELCEALDVAKRENEKLQKQLDSLQWKYELAINRFNQEHHDRCEGWGKFNETQAQLELAEDKAEKLELEVMRLKAKLFDLMFSEKAAG